MSIVIKDTKRKYIMDWNVSDKSIDVLAFGYTQSGATYSLKYEETYKISSDTSDVNKKVYGSWYHTTNQTTTAGTASTMLCNSTGTQSGIVKNTNKDFQVQYDGVYNIQFSVQLDQTSGAGSHIFIWFRKNGVDIPYSASEVAIQGSLAEAIPSWNFVVDMNAGDHLNVMYLVDNDAVYLKAVAPNTIPGIPSVIVTMWRL
jgi:hypothetical protein